MSELTAVLQTFMNAARGVFDAWRDYRVARTQRRIEQVQAYLRVRIDKLDESVQRLEQEPMDADLFMATLSSLIHDDEEAKTGFYAAFLAHLLSQPTKRSELRRVAECFKSLSCAELEYLAGSDETAKLPRISDDWIEVSLPARLQSLGLLKDPRASTYRTRFTSVGLVTRSIAMQGKRALA